MSSNLTYQSLLEKNSRAQKRAEEEQQKRLSDRRVKIGQRTLTQLVNAFDERPYLHPLFSPVGDPDIAEIDEEYIFVSQLVTNTIETETIETRLEQHTDEEFFELRIIHEATDNNTAVRIDYDLRGDEVLERIANNTNRILSNIQIWQKLSQKNHTLAEQIIAHIRDWYQLFTEWDNQCIQLAQETLDKHWSPHMLYRLHYAPSINPAVQTHPLDKPHDQLIQKSIITCTEPNPNRISYKRIAENGDHIIQVILGNLFDYEPLIFDTKPEVNQPLPCHISHQIGNHTICLPPCNLDSYEPPAVPPEPLSWRMYLHQQGLYHIYADALADHYSYDESGDIQDLLTMTPAELIAHNPGQIFYINVEWLVPGRAQNTD